MANGSSHQRRGHRKQTTDGTSVAWTLLDDRRWIFSIESSVTLSYFHLAFAGAVFQTTNAIDRSALK
jgi:hypothetical protein